ncbi:MAG: transcriptional regulator with GAF, ATPase, and Fis domain [Planctomycetota bacterium]|jgi:transcriptional regulator with GAF, ATPase, and Fis domain
MSDTSKDLEALLQAQVECLKGLVEQARSAGTGERLALELERLAKSLRTATPAKAESTGKLETPMRFGMVGASASMEKLFDLLERVAPAKVAVLIQGETGSGKELVARALHDYSPRKDKVFLAENCAAVPANLLESELFGHEKGAFTGAVAKRPGHFVAADGGTLFLDEIGDMPLAMQAKLLRVLQDGEVRPVGSNKTVKVDVRLVAASHKDLPAAIQAGTFREDLYFRLNVITLQVPALREREGDVAHLVRFFLARVGAEMEREGSLDAQAMAALEAWTWPGNVRELENEIRRALALTSGLIHREDLSPRLLAGI